MVRERDLEDVIAAWDRGDGAALREAARPLGVEIGLESATLLGARLSGQQMTVKDVLLTLQQALADGNGIAIREVKNHLFGRYYEGKAYCVAFRDGEHVAVGIGHARNLPMTPADVWPELKPWFKALPKNRARLETWARVRGAKDRVRLACASGAPAAAKAGAATGDALMAEILAHPDDDRPRLVLADSLLERGDVRGELIRLQCELAAAPAHPERKSSKKDEALSERARRIVADFGEALAGEVAAHADGWTFERGFVGTVTMKAPTFRKHGERLFGAQPIRRLQLKPITEDSLGVLAKAPALAKVRSLSLSHGDVYAEKYVRVAPLAGCPHFGSLEELDLSHFITDPGDAERFFAALDAPKLRSIVFDWGAVSGRGLLALAENPRLPALASISMKSVSDFEEKSRLHHGRKVPRKSIREKPEEVRAAFHALGHARARTALRRLAFGWTWVNDAALEALFAGPNAARLEHLDLSYCKAVTDRGIAAIAGSRNASGLKYLEITGTRSDLPALEAIVASRHLANLEVLHFFTSFEGDGGLDRAIDLVLSVPESHRLREVYFNAMDAWRDRLRTRYVTYD